MKYLCQVTEVYRVETETEVETMLSEAKNDMKFDLAKYECKKVETKEDEFFKVSLTKVFNDIKEPMSEIEVSYGEV